MARNSVRKNSKDMSDCCCHMHGKKPLFLGFMLVVIGLALNNNYSFPDVLILIGGILLVKGLIIMQRERK